jgi:hypothetical protein
MRRVISLVFFLTLIAVAATGVTGEAMEAAVGLDPRLADYPVFRIRLSADRIETPALAAAGPTVLVEEQLESGVGHAFVLRIPDEVNEAAVAAALAEPPAAEVVPDWFWQAEFVGNGDRAVAGQPAVALVDLKPGRYLVGDPYRVKAEYARFTVSADLAAPADREEPEAEVVADLFEMGFRLPDTVAAGRQLWRVTNAGALPHEIAIFPVPVGATPEQIETAIGAELAVEFGGDPAAARATIDALGADWRGWSSRLVAGVGALGPQRWSLAQVDLSPGVYGAVCFIPLEGDGTPHVMLGMTEVLTVVPS